MGEDVKGSRESAGTSPGRPRVRVRLVDIAEEAGVSRATVSLALRNHTSIPEKTRQRIQTTARRLGYVYNRGAASLRMAATHTVGVVVNDVTNPYFAEIVAAIQDEMSNQQRVVLFCNSRESHARQVAFVDTIREYSADGVILCPAVDTDPAWVRQVQGWGMPLVLFSRNLPELAIDYAGSDNQEGMRKATEHLLGLGHRRIAMIGANSRISTGWERLAGYLQALEEAGLEPDPALILEGPPSRDFGLAALLQLLDSDTPPTAAVCFNDVLAFGVMLGLKRLGLEAGADFSVVGFDDISEATLWRPALTSPGFSREKLGRAAVSLLLRRLAEPEAPPRQHIIAHDLRIRQSCGPPGDPARLAGARRALAE